MNTFISTAPTNSHLSGLHFVSPVLTNSKLLRFQSSSSIVTVTTNLSHSLFRNSLSLRATSDEPNTQTVDEQLPEELNAESVEERPTSNAPIDKELKKASFSPSITIELQFNSILSLLALNQYLLSYKFRESGMQVFVAVVSLLDWGYLLGTCGKFTSSGGIRFWFYIIHILTSEGFWKSLGFFCEFWVVETMAFNIFHFLLLYVAEKKALIECNMLIFIYKFA